MEKKYLQSRTLFLDHPDNETNFAKKTFFVKSQLLKIQKKNIWDHPIIKTIFLQWVVSKRVSTVIQWKILMVLKFKNNFYRNISVIIIANLSFKEENGNT